MQKIVFWLFDISLRLVKKLESSTPTMPTPLDSHVARWDGGRTLVLHMCRSRMQSPRGIFGPFLKGLGLISNKPDFIILIGVMLHDIGVWHTTYKTTLKSNHPGNLGSGKSSRDPIFLLGLALTIGLDPNSNQRRIFVLIRHPIPVCFLVMPFNQVSFGEMNFMWHHLRILWRKISMKLFKSFVSTNLLFLMDHLLFL